MLESTHVIDLHADDVELIRSLSPLVVDAFRDHAPGWIPSAADAQGEILESLRSSVVNRVLVDSRNEPLGWIAANPQFDGRVWEIHPIAIAPRQQGKGFGRLLVEDIERHAATNGVLTLWAGTGDQTNATTLSGVDLYDDPAEAISNVRNLDRHAYGFWTKVGFVIVGVLPDAEGPGKPEIILAKRVGRSRNP